MKLAAISKLYPVHCFKTFMARSQHVENSRKHASTGRGGFGFPELWHQKGGFDHKALSLPDLTKILGGERDGNEYR